MACRYANAAMLLLTTLGLLSSTERGRGDVQDSTHLPFIFKLPPKNIVWKEIGLGESEAKLFGDENKSGSYGVLIKWMPGHFSRPHKDSEDRYFYVVSGTWWVSSSATYDPKKAYPLMAGSSGTVHANTVNWDGAKAATGSAIVELIGKGPVITRQQQTP
jgi:hypothetical protein